MRVCLSVDVDADSGFRDKSLNYYFLTRGQFGPNVGIKRVLDLFKKYQLTSTFFIPGEVLERFPDSCKEILDAGHDIEHHGYRHSASSEFTLEEEKNDLEKGLEVHQKILGIRPKGYRAPWLGQSERTYELLFEYNFEYDSSEAGQDSPYFLDLKKGKLLEIPSKLELIDTPYFLNFATPWMLPFPVDPETVEKIWKMEFSGMYAEKERGYFVHTVHPFCIGHWHRLKIYENLIAFIKNHSDVSFLTLGELSQIIIDSTTTKAKSKF